MWSEHGALVVIVNNFPKGEPRLPFRADRREFSGSVVGLYNLRPSEWNPALIFWLLLHQGKSNERVLGKEHGWSLASGTRFLATQNRLRVGGAVLM